MQTQRLEIIKFANGRLFIPKEYQPSLDLRETEIAIKYIKDTFEKNLGLTKWYVPGGYELTLVNLNGNDYVQPGYLVTNPGTVQIQSDEDAYSIGTDNRQFVGQIGRDTTIDDLILYYAENVADANIPIGEGEYEPGTVLFPDDQ